MNKVKDKKERKERRKKKKMERGVKDKKDKRKEIFIEKLKTVIDPHTGLNIVDMNMVRDIKIDKNVISLNFVPTTPFCPIVNYFVQAIKDAAREVGFEDCKIFVKA